MRWQRHARFRDQIGIQFGDFPFDADAGCIDGAAGRRGHLGSNAIARNQSNFVRHRSIVTSLYEGPKLGARFGV